MIGIAQGETARLNVTNPDETRPMIINWKLVDSDGEVLDRRDGQPIERTMTLAAGHSAFLQVNADNLLGRDEVRLNFRAVVTFHQADPTDNNPLPPDPCMPSVEIMARLGVGILIIPQKPWDVVATELATYRDVFQRVNGRPALGTGVVTP